MATRFYGLSGSGLDVDQLVKDLMKARRVSYDKIWQQKTQVEWKKKDYNTLYTLAQDFQNSVVSNFRRSSSLLPKQVTSSNEAVVTATANADAANVPHSIIVTQLAEGATITSGSDISQTSGFTGTPFSFNINGKTVNVAAADTLNDVVSNINESGAGVTANYDANLKRFFIYSNETGADAKIDFSGTLTGGQNFLKDTLKFAVGAVDGTATSVGKNALFNLDGVDLSRTSNDFTISDVAYTLNSVSATPTTKTTITVKADIDQTIDNVKSFVEDYNTFIAAVNSELSEDKYREYMPLTDTQKEDMKDSEIEVWEEKAHSGLLRNDSILSEMLTDLRTSLSTQISGLTGSYKSAADIGITTGTWRENGKLYIDEEKLRNALTADPTIVNKIFDTSGTTFDTKGIADRFYDQMKESLGELKSQAGLPGSFDSGSYLVRQLDSYSKRLNTMEDTLQTVEDRYYKQFDAMEVALSKMNQQSSWLFQQFSGN